MLQSNVGVHLRRLGRGKARFVITPVLALGGARAMSSPASAAILNCGDVITSSVTLSGPVGPCAGNGLVITASNITVNLAGHTVSAANGPAETVGITLDNTTKVFLKGGTVTGFDAGVNIDGGSGNLVRNIIARNNVNDNISPADPDNPLPQEECLFGDGITVTDSSNNYIADNRAIANGPFSGISLVGNSDTNTVINNVVYDNNIPNEDAAPGIQGNGFCGAPFARPIQDVGIRVEGPGADANQVVSNDVRNSAIGGITIHGYVYAPPMGGPPEQQNTGNVIRANYVADTGKTTYTVDATADGISVLRQGPARIVGVSQGNTIQDNNVVRSFRDGISLGNQTALSRGVPVTQPGPLTGNTVNHNNVIDSLRDGIRVRDGSVNNTITSNTARNNAEHDGHDANVNCDNNRWSGNAFTWVNQACVAPAALVRAPF